MRFRDLTPQPPLRVDSHHHVWRIARGDYGWLRPDMAIYRDFGLSDLRPLLGDVSATVLVQAAPTEAETDFMLEVAASSDRLVRGVVGWTDLSARNAPDRVAALASHATLRGLRPMLHDLPDPGWINQASITPALAAIQACSLCFDALIRPVHLPGILALCDRHPDLPVVVDHAAKPDIASGEFGPWAAGMARLARETAALCKLSGLVTEAGPDWTVETLRPVMDRLLEWFGPSRLMWGSDWPVVELAGGYRAWRQATDMLLSELSELERDLVLGGTAIRFYGL